MRSSRLCGQLDCRWTPPLRSGDATSRFKTVTILKFC